MYLYDTLIPYKVIDYRGIQYTNCVDYDNICRYRNLRQIVHNADDDLTRFVALEVPNTIHSDMEVMYYTVRASEVNRLDLIADKYLGSSEYAWVLAYLNGIDDGFTVLEGQKLKIPANGSVTSMLEKGEMLQSINPLNLNLSSE